MVLAEDWTFRLFFERRNDKMLEAIAGKKPDGGKWKWNLEPGDVENETLVEYEEAMTDEELKQSFSSYAATRKRANPFIRVTLPAGTQLKIERIYIRQGSEAFASVTFRTTKTCPDKKLASKRFWVKLQEANQIVADILG